jgi:hypothetical protein
MADINDIFQSDTLKASDLQKRSHILCIASVEPKQFNDGPKLILKFQNAKKAMVCNKTNAKRIAFAHGSDYTLWIGKEIELYPDLVQDHKGEIVEAIRVRPPTIAATSAQPVLQQQARPVVRQQHSGVETSTTDRHPNAPGNSLNDDIPFDL